MTIERYTELEELIQVGNKNDVLAKLTEIKGLIDGGDIECIEYISTPANITRIQTDLCSEMGVVRRLLQLRGRTPNAGRRSSLFIQAMMNAVGHLKDD